MSHDLFTHHPHFLWITRLHIRSELRRRRRQFEVAGCSNQNFLKDQQFVQPANAYTSYCGSREATNSSYDGSPLKFVGGLGAGSMALNIGAGGIMGGAGGGAIIRCGGNIIGGGRKKGGVGVLRRKE